MHEPTLGGAYNSNPAPRLRFGAFVPGFRLYTIICFKYSIRPVLLEEPKRCEEHLTPSLRVYEGMNGTSHIPPRITGEVSFAWILSVAHT